MLPQIEGFGFAGTNFLHMTTVLAFIALSARVGPGYTFNMPFSSVTFLLDGTTGVVLYCDRTWLDLVD